MARKPKDTTKDRELLIAADRDFRTSLDHPTWVDFRANGQGDYDYREGNQWDREEKKVLKIRNQAPSVNNQCAVTVSRLVGGFVVRKMKTKFQARTASPEAAATADVLNDLYRHIKQQNRLEYEERDQFKDGSTCGFGVLKAEVTFDDLFQPQIRLWRILGLDECFPDPWSRRFDWNEDALFINHAKFVDFPTAVELWPDYKDQWNSLASDGTFEGQLVGIEQFTNKNYLDLDDKGHPRRVRIIEQWKKHKKREELLILGEAGKAPRVINATDMTRAERKQLEMAGHDVREITRIKDVMHMVQFCGGILLEHKVDPHRTPLFPFIPYYVDRKENGEPFSMIRLARPLQDAINRRESKALHLINTNRATYEKGAISDENKLAEEMAKPDGIIEVNKGFYEKFRIDNNLQLAETQFAMHQSAIADYKRITVNPEAMGDKSEVRSGAGIARKQQATEVTIAPIYDDYRRTREITARLVLALIKSYYTEEKVFLVTNDLKQVQTVHLGAKNIAALKTEIYDVAVEEAPDQTTRSQEQLQILGQVLSSLPVNDPRTLLFLELSDIANKEETIQVFKQMMTPPPPEPRFSLAIQWDALTTPEKIAWAKKLGMPELMQAEMMAPTKPSNEMRQETELKKHTIAAAADGHKVSIQSDTALRKEGMKIAGTIAQQPPGGEDPANGS